MEVAKDQHERTLTTTQQGQRVQRTCGSSDLQKLKEWLDKQPHLPQNIDDPLLLRFLHCCNYSLEQTKSLIDLFYTIRSQAPEIFARRDPKDDSVTRIFQVIDLVPLPKLTEKNQKLFIYRIADPDPDKYNFLDSLRAFFMLADTRLISESGGEMADGEIPIFDMENYSLKHLTKVTLPILRKYMLYTQEAHPIKLRQIHLLNTPPFMDKGLALLKPFIKSEVASMLHFHLPNSETLYQYVSRDLLPEEYGGKVGKMADLKKYWMQKMLDNREFFTDESRWRVDESKRPIENPHGKQRFGGGMQGSFRSLSID